MALLDTLYYDNLFAGDFDVVPEEIVIGTNQAVQRGDVLIKSGAYYVRPSAVVTTTDTVTVASEAITTDASTTTKSIGYRTGLFNSNAMRFGGSSTADDNKDILAKSSIFLQRAKAQ